MASHPHEKTTPVSQRAHKPNPVMQTRDAATKRRREMFFRRVQNGRDDKKWKTRGEQIQQLDFVSERRQWEAEKARQAPPENNDIDEEIIDDAVLSDWPHNTPRSDQETAEADYIAAQEEYELQQLVASMEQETDISSQHYGSDDDDYDSIFMECANAMREQNHQQAEYPRDQFDDVDDMDMDMTDGP